MLLCAMVLVLVGTANVFGQSFFDNFDDGNADGWWLSPRGNWSIENGSLRQDHGATDSGEDHVLGLLENLFISDQIIETQVSTSGYGGVVFWYQDNMNYISVAAYPLSAGLVVWEKIDGVFSGLHYESHTSLNTWYDLRVDADSATGLLAIYIDDTLIFTYNATSFPTRTGQSGVTSGNGGAYFDNFRLTSDDINPEPTIDAILTFFDESVAAGTIYGRGKIPCLANFRLYLFRQMLETAELFIEKEKMYYACRTLNRTLLRCDNEPWPKDFIKGEAVPELADMIIDLMAKLGC